MTTRLRPRLTIAVLAAGLTACSGERTPNTGDAPPAVRVVQGECQPVFGSDVCAWGTMQGDDLTAFGATVPLAAVRNAPPEMEMTFPPEFVAVLPLPEEVTAATGFNHLGINWEPHGHPPGLFLTPHFDFHFYTIDPAAVRTIDCADSRKPAVVPAAYTLPDIDIPGMGVLTGLCVPNMGMHAMLEAELDATELFGASMIIGYYGQELIFLEPMIAQSKLLEAQSFTMPIPVVLDPGPNVRWPAKFAADYDGDTQRYRFTFSGLPTE